VLTPPTSIISKFPSLRGRSLRPV